MCYQDLLINSNQLGFIDLLSIASFCIGLMNLDENLTQNDKQELQQDLSNNIQKLLDEIHGHLQNQDEKIDLILKELEDLKHDS